MLHLNWFSSQIILTRFVHDLILIEALYQMHFSQQVYLNKLVIKLVLDLIFIFFMHMQAPKSV